MRYPRKAAAILIIFALLLSGLVAVSSAVVAAGTPGQDEETRSTINEGATDQTHSFTDAKELQSGDIYYGHLNKVDDKSDFFKIDAAQQDPRLSLLLDVHIPDVYSLVRDEQQAGQVIFHCSETLAFTLIAEWGLPASAAELTELPAGAAIDRLPGMVVTLKVS